MPSRRHHCPQLERPRRHARVPEQPPRRRLRQQPHPRRRQRLARTTRRPRWPREFGDLIEVIRLPENRGFAGGMNAGIKRALELAPDYVLLLNNDTIVDPVVPRRAGRAGASACRSWPPPTRRPTSTASRARSTPPAARSASGAASPGRSAAARTTTASSRSVARARLRRRRVHAHPALGHREGGPAGRAVLRLLGRDRLVLCALARRACAATTSRSRASGTRRRARSSPDARFHYLYRRNALLFVRKRGTPLQVATALADAPLRLRPGLLPQAPQADRAAPAPNCGRSSGTRATNPKERPLI